MAEKTGITWCDATFNPWIGCTKVSQGCKFCYAEELMDHRYKRVQWGPKGVRVKTSATYWKQPHLWNRKAEVEGVRRRVFCASLADVFEDRAEVSAWRNDLFEMIEDTPHLDWLLLTKRPDVMQRYVQAHSKTPLPNVWLGVSAEDQATADERIPLLLRTPAAVRYVSYEPALDSIDFQHIALKEKDNCGTFIDALAGAFYSFDSSAEVDVECSRLDWVIVGGESGPSARPFNVQWGYDTVAQCREAGVAVFVKQLGRVPVSDDYPPGMGHGDSYTTDGHRWLWHLADSHGGDMAQWPEALRVREFPEVAHV